MYGVQLFPELINILAFLLEDDIMDPSNPILNRNAGVYKKKKKKDEHMSFQQISENKAQS